MSSVLLFGLLGALATGAAEERRVTTFAGEVYACLPRQDGSIVAGTDGGLYVLARGAAGPATGGDAAPVASPRTAADGLPGTRVRALVEHEGALFAGTDGGVARLEGGAVTERHASPPVWALASFGGALYAGTWGGGVERRDRDGRWRAVPFAGSTALRVRVTSLASRDGALYAGSAGGGLLVLERGAFRPTGAVLPSAWVWALADTGEALAVGTLRGAVLVARRAGRVVGVDASAPIREADVRALARIGGAGGLLVAGTFGDGLGELSARGDVRSGHSLASPSRFVHSVSARHGVTCVGARDGLFVARGDGALEAVTFAGPPSNDLTALALEGDKLWVGTFDRGLALFESGRWQTITHPLIDARINALAVDGARLVIGTARGLTIREGDHYRRLTEADGLPAREIHALVALPEGGVLVGTARGAAIVRAGVVEALGVKQGFPVDGAVFAVAAPGGRPWLGTSRGLFRMTDMGWERLSVATRALDDDWVTALAIVGDVVYAGTYAGGVSRISPDGVSRLGGGAINPAGLAVRGDTLYAATQRGLLVRKGGAGDWREVTGLPARDVTAVVRTPTGLLIATRAGLVSISQAPTLAQSRPGY